MDGLPLIEGDRVELQPLLNVSMNALEAMGAVELAERQLQISAVLNDEGSVLVSVSDSRPGFAAEHIEQVLGAFVRGPGPNGRGASAGSGLSAGSRTRRRVHRKTFTWRLIDEVGGLVANEGAAGLVAAIVPRHVSRLR